MMLMNGVNPSKESFAACLQCLYRAPQDHENNERIERVLSDMNEKVYVETLTVTYTIRVKTQTFGMQ